MAKSGRSWRATPSFRQQMLSGFPRSPDTGSVLSHACLALPQTFEVVTPALEFPILCGPFAFYRRPSNGPQRCPKPAPVKVSFTWQRETLQVWLEWGSWDREITLNYSMGPKCFRIQIPVEWDGQMMCRKLDPIRFVCSDLPRSYQDVRVEKSILATKFISFFFQFRREK